MSPPRNSHTARTPTPTPHPPQVGSLKQVEDGSGDRFFFDGRRVFIKMTDEGDSSVDPDFREGGAAVHGTRYFNMWWVAGQRWG